MENGYQHKQCPHGRCLNHNPEWEKVGVKRLEPNPGFLGKKTYWTIHCCGKAMARYKEVQTQRCKQCGRTEDVITISEIELCLCCGYHRQYEPHVSYDF